MRVWRTVLLVSVCLLFALGHAEAIVPPNPSRTLPELQTLFPTLPQLPPGMVVQETGERTAEEIAATFPDPATTLEDLSLQMTDWRYNTYRVYVAQPGAAQETPARIEVSLHQFSTSGGAAYMLPYFANGRAAMLDQRVQSPWVSSPCMAWVVGIGETTLYVRIDDLLVRVTVALTGEEFVDHGYYLTRGMAGEVVSAVLANAGSSRQILDQTCQ